MQNNCFFSIIKSLKNSPVSYPWIYTQSKSTIQINHSQKYSLYYVKAPLAVITTVSLLGLDQLWLYTGVCLSKRCPMNAICQRRGSVKFQGNIKKQDSPDEFGGPLKRLNMFAKERSQYLIFEWTYNISKNMFSFCHYGLLRLTAYENAIFTHLYLNNPLMF